MKPKFSWGQPVWPSQALADKSGEIEQGFIVNVELRKDVYIYTVGYKDGFTMEVDESKISSVRPLPPSPNDLLKKII